MTEKLPGSQISRGEWLLVGASAVAASVSAGVWSWRNHAMLNYGDAVAHLHIARRVIDAHEPGLSQFGSVWLPLPHLQMLAFVAVYAWRAFGFVVLFLLALAFFVSFVCFFRLTRRWMRWPAAHDGLEL